MFQFEVRYNYDIYFDYYYDKLIKSNWIKNLIFAILFIGIGVYWFFDSSDNTPIAFPIIAVVMGLSYPFIPLLSIPSLKKQLKKRESEMSRTHVKVTFNEDDVLYENLTEKPVEENVEKTPNPEAEIQRTFNLKYEQFGLIKECNLSFAFYLDRQTVVVIPKECIVTGTIEDFKNFILSKCNIKICRFIKEKVNKE